MTNSTDDLAGAEEDGGPIRARGELPVSMASGDRRRRWSHTYRTRRCGLESRKATTAAVAHTGGGTDEPVDEEKETAKGKMARPV